MVKCNCPERKVSGHKCDLGKLPYSLVPFDALNAVVSVLNYGASKYAPRNWESGMKWSRPWSAAIRHMTQFWEGEDMDRESGLYHIAQAICSLLFLLAYEIRGMNQWDDRPKTLKSDPKVFTQRELDGAKFAAVEAYKIKLNDQMNR